MPDTGTITVLTAGGERYFTATRYSRDADDGLRVYDGDKEIAWFAPGAALAVYGPATGGALDKDAVLHVAEGS